MLVTLDKYAFGTKVNSQYFFIFLFLSSKQRPGFDHSILGETPTGAGQGGSLGGVPPLVVVGMSWKEAGEVNGGQEEHHGLQRLLGGSAGTDRWSRRRGAGGRCRMRPGRRSWDVQYWGEASFGRDVSWFGGREGAGPGVL